LVVEMMQERT
jgi:hypothetical protein